MKSAPILLLVALLATSLVAQDTNEEPQPVQLGESAVEAARSLATPGNLIEDIDAHRVERLPYVRSMDEIVVVDFGPLDLEADIILTVDGEPITRDEFRRRAIMYMALAEVEQQITNVITLDTIEEFVAAGADRSEFMLDDDEIDHRIEETKDLIRMQTLQTATSEPGVGDAVAEKIQAGEETPEELADGAVAQFVDSIEQSVGWESYRDMLAVDAAFEKVFLPMPTEATGEEVHDPATGPVPEDDPKPEWLPQVTWDALGQDDNGRNLRQFVKSSGAEGNPIHPMFKGQVLQSIRKGLLREKGVRYFFDAGLPGDVFVRVGDEDLTTDELWALLSVSVTEPDVEIILRELLSMRAMEETLRANDAWLDDAEFVEIFAAHKGEFEGTLLPLDAIIIFRGYTSVDRYREHYRFREAYHRWRKEMLEDDEIERHYREGARLFFERGNAVVDLAYKGVAGMGPFGGDVFDAAEGELTEAFAGHDDDFRVVAETFPRPLVRQQTGGPNDRVFQRNPLRMRMTESELSIFLSGYSLADDIFYHGVPGQLFGPYATTCRRHAWGAELNAGVWLARLDGYTRSRALAPFDGREKDQAIQDFLDLNYLYWSQECLEEMLPRIEVPAS